MPCPERDCPPAGAAAAACVDRPVGLALDAAGVLYVLGVRTYEGDNGAVSRIWRIGPEGTALIHAGTASAVRRCDRLGDRGPPDGACFDRPSGLAAGPAGELYVADTYNRRVRRIEG